MSLVIDSLRPNAACQQRPSTTDSCEIQATFHLVNQDSGSSQVQEMAEDTLHFRRGLFRVGGATQVRYFLDENRMAAAIRSLLRDHRFDASDPDLQSSLDRSIVFNSTLTNSIAQIFQDQNRRPSVSITPIIEAITHYTLAGNIVSPDSYQQGRNRSLYRGLLTLPEPMPEFILNNVLFWLIDPSTNRSRWSPSMIARLERLQNILQAGERVRGQTSRLEAGGDLSNQVRGFFAQLVSYAYTGEGNLEEIRRNLSTLALEVYRNTPLISGQTTLRVEDRYNLYRIFAFALEPLSTRPPFQEGGEGAPRLATLIRFLQLPTHGENLEYSILSAQDAFESSIYRQLFNQQTLQGILRGINDVIGPPFLTTDWLRSNGYLREIVHAVVSALQVEERGASSSVRVDAAQINRNLQTLFAEHTRDNREFVAGSLAVLRYLFGSNADHRNLSAFFNGRVQEIPLSGSVDRTEIRSLTRSLHNRIRGSLNVTERILPAAEGVLCALGIAGTVADSIRIGMSGGSDTLDHVLMGSSGFMMGSGCTPLLGRAVAGSPQNAWLRDGLLGGAGALGLGTAGALIPLAFPRPMTPIIPPRPIDGRNPVMGNGP